MVRSLQRQTISPEVKLVKRSEHDDTNIDNFITGIREEVSSSDEETAVRRQPTKRRLNYETEEGQEESTEEANKRQARERIISAENHRAQVENPRGIDKSIQIIDDDDLLQITCSIDEGLVEKVEKGKFFEMDKLANKTDELGEFSGDENRMVLVNRGGWSAWEPANNRKQKITNVHQWEKAFRIYMAIFTRANPEKSSEK